MLPARRVRPSGDGTMKASTSRCISQCATFCSMYCSVIPLKIARLGSAWKKQAAMPILSMRSGEIAAAKIRSKSSRVQGRGFVWWQVSWIATSTSAGTSARVTARFAASADSVAGMPRSAFIRASQSMNAAAASRSDMPPAPGTPATRASSAILAVAADRLKRITWSIMMPLASPWCRSATVDSAWAHECTAPRSFWKAIAPIIELISMSLRACRLRPSR